MPNRERHADQLENVLTNVLSKPDSTSSNISSFLSDKNHAAFSSALADIAALTHAVAARIIYVHETHGL